MYERIKTPESRGTKTFRSKRCKTIGPQSCLRDQYRYHTMLDARNFTTDTNGFVGLAYQSNISLNTNQNESAFQTSRPIDHYDEDNQNLTTDFAVEWSRMDAVKKQTYSRLRNKLVKKFPSFRTKYKTEDITQQTEPSIRQSKRSQSENRNRVESSLHTTHKIDEVNVIKTGYFYSRSQKKCLYNSFRASQAPEQERQTPIPRMSFLNYIRNNKERQALKFKKVKGHNMIKTRDKILNLQKQGTQSFLGLKKCLEESIEACITSK